MTPKHPKPTAYSYQTDGTFTTGHRVVIAPGELDAAVTHFKRQVHGKSTRDLVNTLQTAMLGDAAFGSIPHSETVTNELRNFVESHVEAMQQMGGVLADFVARVQAAAQLGYETDPVTRREVALAHKMHNYE